jgi:acetyl esterase/lipase
MCLLNGWVGHVSDNPRQPDSNRVVPASGNGPNAVGMTSDIDALDGKLVPYSDVSLRVRCVVDHFGPSELLTMGDYPSRIDHNAADSPESRLIGGPLPQHPDAARAASPTTYATADDPPFLIIHGDQDPLVPFNQSERLAKALQQVNVECVFIRVMEGGHGGFLNPEISRRVGSFFDKHLRDKQVKISAEPIVNSNNSP